MASKIQGRTMYLAINPYRMDGVEDEFNELSVRVSYDDIHKNFYVAVHAGWKSDFGHGCILMGDSNPLTAPTYIKVKDSPMNSQKFIDDTALALEMAKEGIRLFFDKRDWRMLKWLVESVATVGYTYTIEQKVKEHMTNENKNENEKSSTTMAKNLKAADLIGKVIIVGDNVASITIKSADGDTLQGEFKKGDAPAIAMPIKLAQLEKMLADKVWKIQGEATADETPAADDVEEVDDIKVEGPKAANDNANKGPKAANDNANDNANKAETLKPETSASGKLRYSTYTTKKGKQGAKIAGFGENDAAYLAGPELHGSKVWERDKQGNKTYCLLFSHRYAKAAEDVCKALNAGKSVADCQAIIDGCTEERAQRREEWRQKRAEREAKADEQEHHKGKTYTEAEVADLIKRVVAGDAEAMRIVNELNKAA